MSVGTVATLPENALKEKEMPTKDGSHDYDDDGFPDAYDVALITVQEKAFFSSTTILLDNESSVNVSNNRALLEKVRDAKKTVIMNGVPNGATGVTINQEGEFSDIGTLYFSSANIPSFALQVDSGADVRYNQKCNSFTLKPANSKLIYSFCRLKVPGSIGRFYSCDTRSMISSSVTTHPQSKSFPPATREQALVHTVDEERSRESLRGEADAQEIELSVCESCDVYGEQQRSELQRDSSRFPSS